MFRRVVRGTKCLSLPIIPIPLLIFVEMSLMWGFQERLPSIRTPRYFTYVLRSRDTNEARKSEPARELFSFEFRPSRGVSSAFHMCQITIQ